ncbi:MAG: class I SAM-dependent methyltransferase [Streptosporangiaceae bacterium]
MADFHQHRPGITDSVLARATDGSSRTPYTWLREALPPQGRILDLACGSAPLWPALEGRAYVGVDTSPAELALARQRGARPLLLADATAQPLAAASLRAVVCSMALMLLTPLDKALSEVRRVLAPGGLLIATVPAVGPLSGRDLLLVAALLAALGHPPRYPASPVRDEPAARWLEQAGLCLISDDGRRFCFRLASPQDGDLLLNSLYLPRTSDGARRRARFVLRMAARGHAELPIPIRRIVARRPQDG